MASHSVAVLLSTFEFDRRDKYDYKIELTGNGDRSRSLNES